jgi:hypothetical protein
MLFLLPFFPILGGRGREIEGCPPMNPVGRGRGWGQVSRKMDAHPKSPLYLIQKRAKVNIYIIDPKYTVKKNFTIEEKLECAVYSMC